VAEGVVEPPADPERLASAIDEEVVGLDRELAEIELLIGQARTEAERHEARRWQAEERLGRFPAPAAGTATDEREAQAALVAATRRAVTMQSQVELLEGKQRALARYRDRARELSEVLRAVAIARPAPSAQDGEGGGTALSGLDAQEALRREIARQMHDGPAQSLTNITLQAQIVQRLVGRDDERAQAELTQLVGMVQQTLDATKTFIFDVRPMVLDDLGLVPTLRRAVRDRAQRSGVAVDLEVSGSDRRARPDLESALFRIIDEAVIGFLATKPLGIQVHLEWTESSLIAMVRVVPVAVPAAPEPAAAMSPPAPTISNVPDALADMIRDQREDEAQRRVAAVAAQARAIALPDATWRAIEARAHAAGVEVALTEDGRRLEITADMGPSPT
jgi:two-component system, NarL family, sensor histidine kinase DegS